MPSIRDDILRQTRVLAIFGTPAYIARLPRAVSGKINPALREIILAKAVVQSHGLDY